MYESENESENRMNEKSPNCLTKSDLQEVEALYNNSEKLRNDRITDVIIERSATISVLKTLCQNFQERQGYGLITLTI